MRSMAGFTTLDGNGKRRASFLETHPSAKDAEGWATQTLWFGQGCGTRPFAPWSPPEKYCDNDEQYENRQNATKERLLREEPTHDP